MPKGHDLFHDLIFIQLQLPVFKQIILWLKITEPGFFVFCESEL